MITGISGVLGAESPNLPLLFSHKQNIRVHASLPFPVYDFFFDLERTMSKKWSHVKEFSFTLIVRVLDESKLILDKNVHSIKTNHRVFAWEISAQPVHNFIARFVKAIFAAATEIPLCIFTIAKTGSANSTITSCGIWWYVTSCVPTFQDSLRVDA